MPLWMEVVVSLLLLVGSLFTLIGAVGLYRLPDFFMRLHAPTKATTLGVGSIAIASVLFFSSGSEGPSLHETLLTIFLFMTAPVSAQMMAKAGIHQRLSRSEHTQGRPWEKD